MSSCADAPPGCDAIGHHTSPVYGGRNIAFEEIEEGLFLWVEMGEKVLKLCVRIIREMGKKLGQKSGFFSLDSRWSS